MWPLNLVTLVISAALLAGLYRFGLKPAKGARYTVSLGPLLVALLTFGGLISAHLGMNRSWTGDYLLSDWRWLEFGALFVAALLVASLLLYLQDLAAGIWLLSVVAALTMLGLTHIYVWEARDANAYISTVALPLMREQQQSIDADTTLDTATRDEFHRALGVIPNEIDFESVGLGSANVLNRTWLRDYNQSVVRFIAGSALFPADDNSARRRPERVNLYPATERQLAAAVLGLLLIPVAAACIRRIPLRALARSATWQMALATLVLVGVAAINGRNQELPASIPLGFQGINAYEIIKLGVVVSFGLALWQWRLAEESPSRPALAGMVITLLTIPALAALDPGAGIALALVAGAMCVMVLRQRAAYGLVLALVCVASAGSGMISPLDDWLPGSVSARVDMWSDPAGAYNRSETRNAARATIERMVRRRENGETAPSVAEERPASRTPVRRVLSKRVSANQAAEERPASRTPVLSLAANDIEHLLQELAFRAAALDGTPSDRGPFVPSTDPVEERILAEADDLWFRFAATVSNPPETKRRIAALEARLRERMNELQLAELPADEADDDHAAAVLSDDVLGERDPDNFQLHRAHFALRAGGLLGVGLGAGRPESVPAVTEDVALAAVGESLGLAGSLIVLGMMALLCAVALEWATLHWRTPQALLVACGAVLLLIHAVLSTGGMTGTLPFTGLTFPFISRGGTSLLTNLILVGMIIGLATGGAASDSAVAAPSQARRLRIGIGAALAPLVVALAVVQIGGRSVAPGSIGGWFDGDVSASVVPDQWADRRYLQAAGTITDRNGIVMALSRAPEPGRVYPSKVLATSIAQTLIQLDAPGILDELVPRDTQEGRARLGPTLVTTIDADLQSALDAAMVQGVHEAGIPDYPRPRGAAIALDATTGEILAIVSKPTFDVDEVNDVAVWSAGESADRRENFESRRLNRAIHGYYPPGSVFKTVTAAAALQFDSDWLFDYRSGDSAPREPDGLYQLSPWHQLELPSGSPITCGNHPPEEDWQLDLEEAFSWSCNVAFAEIGLALGADKIVDAARRFGFEREIIVPGLGRSTSSLDAAPDKPTAERYLAASDANLARTAFGQGQTQSTPLQMALVAAGIANRGVVMQPHVIAGWRDASDGSWLARTDPRQLVDTEYSERTLDGLHQIMTASTTYGWARGAKLNQENKNPGVSGKTGSAEWSDVLDAPHAWFIGYFPTEQPRVAIAVVVERGVAGPTVATRVANHFFASQALDRYLKSTQ